MFRVQRLIVVDDADGRLRVVRGGKGDEEVAVGADPLGLLTRIAQALIGELPDRLQQTVARRPTTCSTCTRDLSTSGLSRSTTSRAAPPHTCSAASSAMLRRTAAWNRTRSCPSSRSWLHASVACSVLWVTADRLPRSRTRSASPSRDAISLGARAEVRAAASSRASGIPSQRHADLGHRRRGRLVEREVRGRASALARRTAVPTPAPPADRVVAGRARSGRASDSGTAPTRSGSRLANTITPGQPRNTSAVSRAHASSRCSQLSGPAACGGPPIARASATSAVSVQGIGTSSTTTVSGPTPVATIARIREHRTRGVAAAQLRRQPRTRAASCPRRPARSGSAAACAPSACAISAICVRGRRPFGPVGKIVDELDERLGVAKGGRVFLNKISPTTRPSCWGIALYSFVVVLATGVSCRSSSSRRRTGSCTRPTAPTCRCPEPSGCRPPTSRQ